MIPYFSTSIIVISIKIASASMLPLDHPVTFRAYMEMFYLPAAGYYLWFIWALWWMMVLIPFFKTVKSRLMLFTFSAILFFCQESFPEVFCLQQTASYMVFFTGGTVISDFMRRYEIPTFSTSTQWGSVIVFISLAAYILIDGFIDYDALSIATIMLATNISGIAAFFSLSAMFTRIAGSRALQSALSIASASYIIYLFHTTFEGFAKGIAAKIGVFSWNPTALWCWLGAFSVIACGIMIPWWLGRKILPRWNLTRFLFGLPSRRE
ncbi:MAG: hypothetical protein K2I18_01135 [Paramuribaculum sp.]|nr:hypothetical protein [Paramuribaculum sp.]